MDSALAFQSLSLILQSSPFPLITAQLVLLITLHSMMKYFLVVGWRSTNTCLCMGGGGGECVRNTCGYTCTLLPMHSSFKWTHFSLFIVGCLDDLALECEKSRALQETITVLNGRICTLTANCGDGEFTYTHTCAYVYACVCMCVCVCVCVAGQLNLCYAELQLKQEEVMTIKRY